MGFIDFLKNPEKKEEQKNIPNKKLLATGLETDYVWIFRNGRCGFPRVKPRWTRPLAGPVVWSLVGSFGSIQFPCRGLHSVASIKDGVAARAG